MLGMLGVREEGVVPQYDVGQWAKATEESLSVSGGGSGGKVGCCCWG